ncbi:MAG: LamG domain-containing protein [Planctomycetota bacterium]
MLTRPRGVYAAVCVLLVGSVRLVTGVNAASAAGLEPAIEFTAVPPWGSEDDLQGRVANVDASSHYVAVYLYVGGWWTKPTFDQAAVSIKADGSWTADITTGGQDTTATKIAAFLLPAAVVPPRASGQATLPRELEGLAVASAVAERAALAEQKAYRRFLEFSGYRWSVKARDVPVGPGPNRFSDRKEDVWVDREGLHLTIRENDGVWYCTEVILQKSFGYGMYVFHTRCQPDALDPNVVAGMFTWETEAPFPHRELDFEYSRWGDADDPTNAQFVIQPYKTPGNLLRYRVEPTEADTGLTHVMAWQEGRVRFTTARGHHAPDRMPEDKVVSAWTYTGQGVPRPGNENVRINLWLDGGKPPQSGKPAELVVTKFAYASPGR